MHTEDLYQTLSPQAYAAVVDAIHRQARRERRLAVRRFGRSWPARVRQWAGRLGAHLARTAPLAHAAKA